MEECGGMAECGTGLMPEEGEEDLELGDEPVRMDMLILKQDAAPLTDPVGSFFNTHNILEYKRPEDELSIDVFAKVMAYAYLYKSQGKPIDAIPMADLTVTLYRHSYPRELFRKITGTGLQVSMKAAGI